jgi:hypothetical protein
MLLVSLMGFTQSFPHFLLVRGLGGEISCLHRQDFPLMASFGINERPLNPSFDFSLNGQRIRT